MYETIKEQFKDVISYSQMIPDPKVDELFAKWQVAKASFIRAFGNNLIYEYPDEVSLELSDIDKAKRIDNFIDMVANRYNNDVLADFIDNQKEGFFSNQVVNAEELSNGTKIPIGMKLLKSFKFFEDNEKKLADIQSAASMIIQEDKIKGKLCLSVHPLDFLSLSENNHNWRSCHALNGEYRGGNLSYMVDSTTIVCYLKSNREEILPDFPENVPWNSKKWRVLLFVSDNNDMLFAGRQYPFNTQQGIDFVRECILPLAGLGFWENWSAEKIREINGVRLYSPYILIGHSLQSLKEELVINEPGSLQFNDLVSSNCYDPIYSFKRPAALVSTAGKRIKFHVGGKVNCLHCGKQRIEISESMMCNDCELKYGTSDNDIFSTCPCCGNRYYNEDGFWIANSEEYICSSCAEGYTDFCSCCGDAFYKDDLMYDEETGDWMCRWCWEDNN